MVTSELDILSADKTSYTLTVLFLMHAESICDQFLTPKRF